MPRQFESDRIPRSPAALSSRSDATASSLRATPQQLHLRRPLDRLSSVSRLLAPIHLGAHLQQTLDLAAQSRSRASRKAVAPPSDSSSSADENRPPLKAPGAAAGASATSASASASTSARATANAAARATADAAAMADSAADAAALTSRVREWLAALPEHFQDPQQPHWQVLRPRHLTFSIVTTSGESVAAVLSPEWLRVGVLRVPLLAVAADRPVLRDVLLVATHGCAEVIVRSCLRLCFPGERRVCVLPLRRDGRQVLPPEAVHGLPCPTAALAADEDGNVALFTGQPATRIALRDQWADCEIQDCC